MDAALLSAIGSPRRREILRLLWDQDLTAGAIHQAMPDVTFGAVSLQLKVLADAGLVESRTDAQFRVYRARREVLGPVAAMLETMWTDALWGLKLKAELKEHVVKEIGAIARPDDIRFTDALPKTRSGKIMRRLLRDIAAGKETMGDTTTLEDLSVLAKLREEDE